MTDTHTLSFDTLKQTYATQFIGDAITELTPLAGQASSRRYFRVHTTLGKTWVLMQLPPEGNRLISDEATGKEEVTELPFIAVGRYLEAVGMRVPHVAFYLEHEGQLLLEDIGDESFERWVNRSPSLDRVACYRRAIDFLVELQLKTACHPDPAGLAFTRSFDFELLYWECIHFIEYGIEDYFGVSLPLPERTLIEREFSRLCRELVQLPVCFVHRDFQSRNLHVYAPISTHHLAHGAQDAHVELVCIDFQDALQGPFVYDLVALLRDSYIVLSAHEIDALLSYYWQRAGEAKLPVIASLTETHFRRAFHLQALQRKLKDTGRFQFIHTVRKNSAFLKYREPSLGYIIAALNALPDYAELHTALLPYLKM